MSVKTSPKRLNFYGQTGIFAQFVRNRLFSSRPITDKASIFIDVSVNGSDFAKCSALNQCVKLSVKFTARLFFVISVMASDCHAYEKNGSDLRFESS
ncbi:hypothetical protein GKD00_00455 [Lactobacillus ruminis]|nr:hypothetical protein [Ligilactobacillus ruminis]MSB53465.1 hypothetical protein [Ligilactobacillus ruminis]MSB55434.1 hypothetical protein [Ligilactobacillus ruminis]MSB80474.1 hypothetical protein [Ligilactobacillus ruminis]MSB90147.1 hypothetical protein [Ligilactobacillus ruminis]